MVSVEARRTAVIAATTTWEEYPNIWPRLLDEVYAFVRHSDDLVIPGEVPRWKNVMLYNDGRPSVEVGVLAARPFRPEGRILASELPAGRTAMAMHRGDYARLGATHRAVNEFAEAEELALAGPRWEIYGHWRENPDELETEVYWLLS